MKRVSRRSFVAGMGAMPFALWLQKERIPIGPLRKKWVRYEARTTEGQKMLKIYADTVNKMMNSTTAGDPRSWIFQWYTHAVRPDRTKAGEISSIYGGGSSPNKTLATDAWSTCQPHFSGDEPSFLPWHRMFVYFLESIVRKASGNDDFSLPYWNYSVTGSVHGVIPPEFTNSSDPTLKWLYRADRNPGVNTGTAIDTGDPGALDLTALKQTTYEPNGAAPGFNADLDGGIHGAVHVDTGNSTNMGSVPWAARDPIFWMHHCNLDRLWASWNKNGGVNPGGGWLTKSFTFADLNGTKVVATVSNFDSLSKLDYTYDRLEPAPFRIPFLPWPFPLAHPTPLQIHELTQVPLTAQTTRLAMTAAKVPQAPPEPFTAHVARLAPEKSIYLVIKNLQSDVHPGVTYQVFLDLPSGKSPNEASAHRVGTINFFGTATQHALAAAGQMQMNSKFFSFDITDIVKGLQANKLLQDKPVVTIVPAGKPAADAKPVVGEISIQEQ
jgi:tyrosinase